MLDLAKELFPINRSISGKGVRKTLKILKKKIPYLKIKSFRSNLKVFDWKVPLEWDIKDAYIITPKNKKICEFKKNNLHIVGYSKSINKYFKLKDLKKKIHSIKNQKNAIPYITSYYKNDWGFCMKYAQKNKLSNGIYKAVIKSTHFVGKINYGEILIRGKSKKEIFLSTYICHPSLANNEISGPVLLTELTKWLNKKKRRYSYRIIFIPETIGSIAYLHKNLKIMKKNIFAGFNVTCVGDERNYSYIPSRNGNTISDRIATNVLKKYVKSFRKYEWKDRGSDERQYCSPGIDLPICSIMRTKYGKYKEYHTSLDRIGTVLTNNGLKGSLNIYKKTIQKIEKSYFPKTLKNCEPFMSKYNLYPTLSKKNGWENLLINILTWCDGNHSIEDIKLKCRCSKKKMDASLKILTKKKLISMI
jgi:aminopeptidase-like protein